MQLSVIIPTLNRSKSLDRCLTALEIQTMPSDDFEVIIVDNGSNDDTDSVAAAYCGRNSNFIYVSEQRRGLSIARNAGIQKSSSDIVAFTDDDAAPERDWVERLTARFAELSDDVAVVGGEIIPVWEAERPKWLTEALLRPLSAGLMWSPEPRLLRQGEWIIEVNCAYRKHHLVEFGGFPEHLGRTGDVLLSGENCVDRLMEKANLKLFYDPAILVRHYIPASRLCRTWFRRRFYWQGVTMNLIHRYVEVESAKRGISKRHQENGDWEEIIVPISAQSWADLFDDRSSMPFEQQLHILEQIGYFLESQSVVIGRN